MRGECACVCVCVYDMAYVLSGSVCARVCAWCDMCVCVLYVYGMAYVQSESVCACVCVNV